MNNPKLLALITIVFWSFGPFLSRLIAIKSQFILLSLSYIFTFLTILGYCIYEYKKKFFLKIKATWVKGLLVGPFGYFIYSVSLIQSYRVFNSASETTILNYTWPIFTVIFTELFFRKKTRKSSSLQIIEVAAIILGFLSVIVLASKGNIALLKILNIKGFGWGLLSGISYGIFSSYSGTISKDEQSAFLFSSISFSLILMLILSVPELNLIETFTTNDLLIVATLGCLLNGIGYITWTASNRLAREKNISISTVASLMFVLPLLSLVIISALLKETQLFQPYFIVSLFLIILSGVLSQKAEIAAKLLHLKL